MTVIKFLKAKLSYFSANWFLSYPIEVGDGRVSRPYPTDLLINMQIKFGLAYLES